MALFEELTWRGLIHQATHPELAEELEKAPMTVYSLAFFLFWALVALACAAALLLSE